MLTRFRRWRAFRRHLIAARNAYAGTGYKLTAAKMAVMRGEARKAAGHEYPHQNP